MTSPKIQVSVVMAVKNESKYICDALDSILFYVFWEAMLIPMFLIIGIWGGPNRVYATIKFFLYTFLGSVFMLVALLYLYSVTGSFNIQLSQEAPLGLTADPAVKRSSDIHFVSSSNEPVSHVNVIKYGNLYPLFN